MPRMRRRAHSFFAFGGSPFSEHQMGAADHTLCATLGDGLEAFRAHLLNNYNNRTADGGGGQEHETEQRTFSYIYTNEPDHTEHAEGFDSEAVGELVRSIDAQCQELWASLPGGLRRRLRLVITADHGHVVVPAAMQLVMPVPSGGGSAAAGEAQAHDAEAAEGQSVADAVLLEHHN